MTMTKVRTTAPTNYGRNLSERIQTIYAGVRHAVPVYSVLDHDDVGIRVCGD
jgi:hypothetical protein